MARSFHVAHHRVDNAQDLRGLLRELATTKLPVMIELDAVRYLENV
jgi:acetolactate synthase-1/2/3 large subunit